MVTILPSQSFASLTGAPSWTPPNIFDNIIGKIASVRDAVLAELAQFDEDKNYERCFARKDRRFFYTPQKKRPLVLESPLDMAIPAIESMPSTDRTVERPDVCWKACVMMFGAPLPENYQMGPFRVQMLPKRDAEAEASQQPGASGAGKKSARSRSRSGSPRSAGAKQSRDKKLRDAEKGRDIPKMIVQHKKRNTVTFSDTFDSPKSTLLV